jgi:hypothetical protein
MGSLIAADEPHRSDWFYVEEFAVMTRHSLMLADGITDYLPWYSWVAMAALVIIIVAYKLYQKKMME